MRNKLIEILESAESAVYWNSDDRNFIERIADHLIANGVTVGMDTDYTTTALYTADYGYDQEKPWLGLKGE